MTAPLTPSLRRDYLGLLQTCQIAPGSRVATLALAARILTRKPLYMPVANATGVPWFFIALVHQMEGGANFKTHLHNGDPLTARTVHVPRDRPRVGNPPFTWTQSAIDALVFEGLNKWTDWSASGLLYRLESYNGFGYRKRGLNSPYLWAKSNHEMPGKFLSDGVFSPNARSEQIGAATLLHTLKFLKIVDIPNG